MGTSPGGRKGKVSANISRKWPEAKQAQIPLRMLILLLRMPPACLPAGLSAATLHGSTQKPDEGPRKSNQIKKYLDLAGWSGRAQSRARGCVGEG